MLLYRDTVTRSHRFSDCFFGSSYQSILLAWSAWEMVALPTSPKELARKQSLSSYERVILTQRRISASVSHVTYFIHFLYYFFPHWLLTNGVLLEGERREHVRRKWP